MLGCVVSTDVMYVLCRIMAEAPIDLCDRKEVGYRRWPGFHHNESSLVLLYIRPMNYVPNVQLTAYGLQVSTGRGSCGAGGDVRSYSGGAS